jgi:putative ABC transport system ATP-binding protein
MASVSVRDLTKVYSVPGGDLRALDHVTLDIAHGEFAAVVGTSGSGKTTLLNLMGGLDRPTSGQVTIRDHDLARMSDDELTVYRRRHVGFVFQQYNLIPLLSVEENITFPLELDGRRPEPERIDAILDALGLAQRRSAAPATLSGGQQQRVAIGRALATRPALLLADEPTGNLDSKTGLEVVLLLRRGQREFGQTTVIITHNEDIAQMADRVLRLEDGRLVQG